jgi:glycine dehydrogenase subunit 1
MHRRLVLCAEPLRLQPAPSRERGIMAGVPVSRLLPGGGLDDALIIASTEVNTPEDRAALVAALKETL